MITSKIMTTDVVTVSPESGIERAYRLMEQFGVRRIPVVDREGALVGIVSDSDIRQVLIPLWKGKPLASRLKRSASTEPPARNKKDGYLPDDVTVAEVMTTHVITVGPEAPISEAITLIHRNNIGGLPVVDEGGKLVGIITRMDLITLLFDMINAESPEPPQPSDPSH